ncbi:PQQ-binding-like beta-propeller repeat protein [Emcibacter sp.]|uniref:outer membrane protein assembly factor BamB family protein n=1 Tax=Emcibacter sp. TaxID=1979954 RepID=UPI002AA78E62|nr:PQQ-binding-like beta-propeller repeat protein [Emcibacter sp.]
MRQGVILRQCRITSVLAIICAGLFVGGVLFQSTLQASPGASLGSVDDLQAKTEGLDVSGGARLFAENCVACHDGTVAKAPHSTFLKMMSQKRISFALTEGMMKAQASHLTADDKVRLVEFLTNKKIGSEELTAPLPRCEGQAAVFDRKRPPPAVGWGHDTSRFVPAAVGGLTAEDMPHMKLKWAFAYPGALRARSQPAIGYGAVFVGSHDGTVYAFDLENGCVRWTFQAVAEVRNGIVLTPASPEGETPAEPLAYFGDILANAYAVNALTGKEVWRIKADDHTSATLTGTAALHDNILYIPVSSLEVTAAADPAYECCSFRGKVMAVDVRDGTKLWQAYSIPEPPSDQGKTSHGTVVLGPSGAPVWNSPAIDDKRGVFYVGSGENYSSPADDNSDAIFAFDLTTGKRIWHVQAFANDAWNVACMMQNNPNCPRERGPDYDFAASPILVHGEERDILVAGQKSGLVHGLDPDDSGRILWQTRVGRGGTQGGVHFGMSAEGTRVYVPIVDMENARDGTVHKTPAQAGIHAVDALTGRIIWRHVVADNCGDDRPYCDPGISAATTAIPGAVIAGHLDGMLRAYNGKTGKVIWEFDTTESIKTITGETGRGGSMSSGGPAVTDGYLVVNSGYGLYFHEPGNLLLVFERDDRD